MKKIISTLTILLAIVTFANAGEVNQSLQLNKDHVVATGDGYWHGIIFNTDGVNEVTCDIYDNGSAAASDRKLVPTLNITPTRKSTMTSVSIDPPVRYFKGVYVDITTSGAVKYMIYKSDR